MHILNPISERVVGNADRFIFSMSDTQLKEYIKDFNEREPYVYILINGSCELLRGEVQSMIFWKLALTIDYCYNSYELPTEPITMNDITNQMKWQQKLIYEVQHTHGTITDLPHLMADLDQINLLNYIGDKVNYYSRQDLLLNLLESQELLLMLMTLGYVYQNNYKSRTRVLQN
jgi:hypothetical protein